MDDTFQNYFYSREFNAQGLTKFKDFLEEKNVNFTNKEVTDWYKRQEVVHLLKPKTSRKKFNPILTLKHNHVLYMDILEITSDKLVFIVAMDLFSKKAYVKSKKRKLVITKKGNYTPKFTARECVAFLDNILRTDKYTEIRTDDDTAFMKEFKTYCNENNLKHLVLLDEPKRLLSPIERFNLTFRRLYEKKKEIWNQRVYQDHQKFADEIIKTYNNTKHSTTKNSPQNVYENVDGVRNDVIQIYKNKFEGINADTPLPVGTKIRLYEPPKKSFNKTQPNWSRRIYTIEEDTYDNKLRRYRFTIKGRNRLYDRDFVQVVPEQVESFMVR